MATDAEAIENSIVCVRKCPSVSRWCANTAYWPLCCFLPVGIAGIVVLSLAVSNSSDNNTGVLVGGIMTGVGWGVSCIWGGTAAFFRKYHPKKEVTHHVEPQYRRSRGYDYDDPRDYENPSDHDSQLSYYTTMEYV